MAGNRCCEVSYRFSYIENTRILHSKNVSICGFGGGVGDEVGERAAGIICQLCEKGLRFSICKGPHLEN